MFDDTTSYQQAEKSFVVERSQSGRPHAGKVFAAIQAHADDIPFYCAGTLAKLIAEGYTGYLIQTTNDEKCGPTPSLGQTILSNEQDVERLADVLGLRRVFFLGYRNHRMDGDSPLELRARLIFLFRLFKIDTVFTFNPWGQWEENPDHWVTARAVEAACWMSGMDKDYPEHLAAGIMPHNVRERYFWVARHGQPFNRVVDIGEQVESKIAALSANKAQGPAGACGRRLKARLAEQGLRLPELGDDDEAADRAYIKLFALPFYEALARPYGLKYAEYFYYFGPDEADDLAIHAYISQHAVPLRP